MDKGQHRRVQYVAVQRGCCLGQWAGIRLPRVHQRPILLRPHSQIFDPLVKPGGFERARRHFRKCSRGVRPAKSTEGFLRQ